ncbi:MAG: hypothetical protein IR158_14640 [Cellulomonas sp.]|uniref:hypothetical protein n=1 Tax=Cellulomonas sp. TaxID=40001 RepID=UPI0019F9B30E|nr:hypothetical protein [Cellulomonas sp.]MBF0688990.1 hypothetical protein [Cellulomonas sp.]
MRRCRFRRAGARRRCGTVDVGDDHVFFPQWTGIPDDAGGFFHMRSGSPAGLDMRGWTCADPVHLDGDWWACGMG